MSLATLGGFRVVRADIAIHYRGIWNADVQIDGADPFESGDLAIGALKMRCAGRRGGPFAGASSFRVYGGAGLWRKRLPAKWYQQTGAVKLSLVVKDAATECGGESVDVKADREVGNAYTRLEAAAAHVLNELAPSWFVSPSGVTTIGPRAATPIASAFTVTAFDPATGRAEIATEVFEDWTPGRIVTIEKVAYSLRSVRHVVDAASVRTIASFA